MMSYSFTFVIIHASRYTLAYHVPHAKHKESSLGHRYSVGCARCYDAWDSRLISYLLRFLTATFSLDHAQVLHVPTWELKGSPQVCTRPHREFFMGPDFYKQHNIIFDKFYFHCHVVGQCRTQAVRTRGLSSFIKCLNMFIQNLAIYKRVFFRNKTLNNISHL